MGLFKEFEITADIFNPVDNTGNDTVSYPATPSSSMDLHIIRLNNSEVNVFGDEIADFVTNPDGDQTSNILKNARIEQSGDRYQVVSNPQYRPLSKTTSIDLKRIEEPI